MSSKCRNKAIESLQKYEILPYYLIVVLGYLVYVKTFGNAWTFDDFPVIVTNPDIRSIDYFIENSYRGRPLREVSFIIDYYVFGANPKGWHIQHIFWHGLNACLVFLLSTKLHSNKQIAWIASLFFLVHPIQVEVVAQISHRKDSLALAFSLMSILSYIRWTESPSRSFFWIVASLIMAALGCMAKENAVVLPIAFIAYELAYVPADKRVLLKHKRALSILSIIAIAMIAFWMVLGGGYEIYADGAQRHLKTMNYFETADLGMYFLALLKAWSFMFMKLLIPINLSVNYVYQLPESLVDPWVLSTLAGLCIIIVFCVRQRGEFPLVVFSLTWFISFWLPTSNIWPLSYFAADRYLYSPSVGFFLILAWCLDRCMRKSRVVPIIILLVLSILTSLTWTQCQVWESNRSLWSHSLMVNPNSSRALSSLAILSLSEGDRDEALRLGESAVELNPYEPLVQLNLGIIYEETGEVERALAYYGNFLKLQKSSSFRADSLKRRIHETYGVTL